MVRLVEVVDETIPDMLLVDVKTNTSFCGGKGNEVAVRFGPTDVRPRNVRTSD